MSHTFKIAGLVVWAYIPACGTSGDGEVVPLKDAKLNIEHNATDNDTGFQGFVDSEGWEQLDVIAPDGNVVLHFEGRGDLGQLGLTELFFETVEPANVDVSVADMLAKLGEGEYLIEGPAMENGERLGTTSGTAWLTHAIPAGPTLLEPAAGAVVPTGPRTVRWSAVTHTITGAPVDVIAYQLIVERDADPHPHIIGKLGSLSMYLPASVTSIELPDGFLTPHTPYKWEVLAIEESGNQTLSSGEFSTQ